MILANVRGRLRPADLRLAVLALARGDATRRAAYERALAEEGPDAVLDAPGLLEALLAVRSLLVPSAPLFAYVAVRHALRAGGVDDRQLADYLAALVLEFGDHDRHVRIRAHDDETYRYLVDIVSDLAEGGGGGPDHDERAFLLLAHLGNYSSGSPACFPTMSRLVARRPAAPTFPTTTRSGGRAIGWPPSTAWRRASACRASTVWPPSGSPRCASPSTG